VADASDTRPQYKLIGQNYQTPDIVAKVTGRAHLSASNMIVQSLEEGRRVDRGLTANV
jgi:hypothetical protein